MDALTIHQAAETTDWSPRMLRYIEDAGLIEPRRSPAGYRLYGAAELQRLRTLRELVTRFGIGLGDIGFAMRLRRDEELASAVAAWSEAQPRRPEDVPPAEWLRWEQDKHSKLLALAAAHERPEPIPA
jgi:MerR family copper efflux transcriptional regulator